MEKVSDKVLYPDLSYKIVGIAFNVFNEVGFGFPEKLYQQAFAKMLEREGIHFEKEKSVKIKIGDDIISNYFLDFIIDGKIIVELKIRPRLGYVHIKQVMGYLKATNLKLAILIYFTRDGVKYRRVLNALNS